MDPATLSVGAGADAVLELGAGVSLREKEEGVGAAAAGVGAGAGVEDASSQEGVSPSILCLGEGSASTDFDFRKRCEKPPFWRWFLSERDYQGITIQAVAFWCFVTVNGLLGGNSENHIFPGNFSIHHTNVLQDSKLSILAMTVTNWGHQTSI